MNKKNDEQTAENPRDMVKSGFPRKLLDGYADFRNNRLSHERERYEQLAESGQKPETMIIACCDSRSAPETIFGGAPGEMFVVRNVANLVPPFEDDGHYHGTSAALEFAVQALQVKHIVVMGHGRCGGIDAFRRQLVGEESKPLTSGNFIGKWISLLEPVANKVERVEGETEEELQGKLEAESIRQSIEHLKTFPFIASLFEREQIGLHGAWFDISSGDLWTMDEKTGVFEKPVG